MDLEDLDIQFDWDQMDILNSVTPSLLNNPAYGPQQVNLPSVQDTVGTVFATENQVQNAERKFNIPEEANSSRRGNPSQVVVDDHYPLHHLSPTSSAPLLDETQSSYYIPPMEGLISEGAGSSTQGQQADMTPMNYYDQFSLIQNNNLPLMHDVDRHNEQNAINQLLMPNILENHNFNGISNQTSSYPAMFQQNPVEAGAGNETTNGQFMNNQRSPLFALNNHAINPGSAWDSPRSVWLQDQGNDYNSTILLDNPGFQQQSSTLNGPPALSNGFTTSSVLNSAILEHSGPMITEGSTSQVFNTEVPQVPSLLRPERAPAVQPQQVAPLPVNTITPQRLDSGLPISPAFGAQPSVPIQNMLNQNGRSTVTSYRPYTTLQQSTSLNLQYERQEQPERPRRGRPRKQFEPSEVSTPYKRRKKASTARENAGKTPNGVVMKEDQNANPTNPSSAATRRIYVNAMYDPAFERAGVPIDPLLRLFKAASEKPAGPATTR